MQKLKILKSNLAFTFIILVKSSVVVSAKEPATKYLKIKSKSVLFIILSLNLHILQTHPALLTSTSMSKYINLENFL